MSLQDIEICKKHNRFRIIGNLTRDPNNLFVDVNGIFDDAIPTLNGTYEHPNPDVKESYLFTEVHCDYCQEERQGNGG